MTGQTQIIERWEALFDYFVRPIISGSGEKEGTVSIEQAAGLVTTVDERLRISGAFVARGAPYLEALTKRLSVFEKVNERRFWGRPKYDRAENKKRIDLLEKSVSELLAQLAPLQEEPFVGKIVGAFQKVLEDLPAFRKKYLDTDISDPDQEKLELLQTEWTLDWDMMLKRLIPGLTKLDEFTGVARGIIRHGLKSPRFTEQPNTFTLRDSKPLFPEVRTPFIKRAVPQTVVVNPEKPVMVLTGPNSSGKSVLMFNSRMNALLALNGFYVSGDLEMSKFDKVYAFFGGENVSEFGESYFFNILKKYSKVLSNVTPNSLVILDELHGTDNFELAAIQLMALHYLRQMNVTVIFNTHIRDGLKLAAEKVGLDFWKTDVTYHAEKHKAEPHYTVSPDPNLEAKSYGLAVARQWLSEDQVHRAESILQQLAADGGRAGDGGDAGRITLTLSSIRHILRVAQANLEKGLPEAAERELEKIEKEGGELDQLFELNPDHPQLPAIDAELSRLNQELVRVAEAAAKEKETKRIEATRQRLPGQPSTGALSSREARAIALRQPVSERDRQAEASAKRMESAIDQFYHEIKMFPRERKSEAIDHLEPSIEEGRQLAAWILEDGWRPHPGIQLLVTRALSKLGKALSGGYLLKQPFFRLRPKDQSRVRASKSILEAALTVRPDWYHNHRIEDESRLAEVKRVLEGSGAVSPDRSTASLEDNLRLIQQGFNHFISPAEVLRANTVAQGLLGRLEKEKLSPSLQNEVGWTFLGLAVFMTEYFATMERVYPSLTPRDMARLTMTIRYYNQALEFLGDAPRDTLEKIAHDKARAEALIHRFSSAEDGGARPSLQHIAPASLRVFQYP